MRKTCPCGCGRPISLGLAAAARDYSRLIEDMDGARGVFAWAAQAVPPDEPDRASTQQDIVVVRELGEHVEGLLLAHLHGSARAGVAPTVAELHRRMEDYEEALEALGARWQRAGGGGAPTPA